jgi:alpha-tubulin suppressor-like RCC1 family protein
LAILGAGRHYLSASADFAVETHCLGADVHGRRRRSKMKQLLLCASIVLTASYLRLAVGAAEPLHFVTVTAGADHACALTDRGDAYCWGSNEFGQLGNGLADSVLHAVPVRVSGGLTFTNVVAGLTHTCGIVRDGAAVCWGANDTAQLGDGTLKPSPTPVRVASDIRFQTIGPGGTHTCAVSVDGIGYCWGGNWHGQLGVGNRDGDPVAPLTRRVPTPIQTDLRFRTAVAGGISSCGVALDGKAYCWGSPQEGRLGTGTADAANKFGDKSVPTAVAGDVRFVSVARSAWHTCGLSSTNAVFCWGGAGIHGVLGSGIIAQTDSPVPNRVAADMEFSTVSSGLFHNCALTRDRVAYCWGENTDGELGDGTTHDAAAPQRVATSRRFVSLAVGGNLIVAKSGDVTTWGFTCGLTADDGTVLCWGDNRHGTLGNGSTTRALTPTPISNP